MNIIDGLFTSEAVSAGHPDKLCDRISDSILDAFLSLDPSSRVACEALAADNKIVVAGEFSAAPGVYDAIKDQADSIVRRSIAEVGYGSSALDIDPVSCEVEIRFNHQSPEIRQGVDGGARLGAGDQGIMFGFACDETPELMPLAWSLANALLVKGRDKNELIPLKRGNSRILPLRPDAKSQVTVRYEGGRLVGIQAVVLSWQHQPEIDVDTIREWLSHHIVDAIIPLDQRTSDFVAHINPAGSFIRGGPKGDTGLTGRKIVADTYGGSAPHGGGAFSGKDASKVDRSAAYAARWVAKNLVAAGLAQKATVQLSYAIGYPDPVSISVDTHGTGRVTDPAIVYAIQQIFDLSPAGIIERLKLQRPRFTATSSYGHFGASAEAAACPWEAVDRVSELQKFCGV